MKRTNVYADPADLALIKAAAAQRGVSEAELIREGIRLAALGARVWDTPIVDDDETFDLGGPIRRDDIRAEMNEHLGARHDRPRR